MIEEQSTPGASGDAGGYAYPGDLARLVRARWSAWPEPAVDTGPVPDAAALEEFFSACYQASMLREEERPVTFRAVLAEPTILPQEGTPPDGHRAAYRLVGALPGAVAIVISQDGGVRFVAQKGSRVTYWEQE